jgi:hypothetical protein
MVTGFLGVLNNVVRYYCPPGQVRGGLHDTKGFRPSFYRLIPGGVDCEGTGFESVLMSDGTVESPLSAYGVSSCSAAYIFIMG